MLLAGMLFYAEYFSVWRSFQFVPLRFQLTSAGRVGDRGDWGACASLPPNGFASSSSSVGTRRLSNTIARAKLSPCFSPALYGSL